MNKKILFLLATSFMIVACNTTPKVEKMAKEQAIATFHELAKNPESVKITNVRSVFTSEALCLLRLDFTAKNGFGNENTTTYEYVYYIDGDKAYEAEHELAADSIFISESVFDKKKEGKIWGKLSYADAIAYRSLMFLNSDGRQVGDSEASFKLITPTGTGDWELKNYTDEFDEETYSNYLVLVGHGSFSNSATTGSKLRAILFVDNTSISLRLVEYNTHVVKDDEICTLKVKDNDGETCKMYLYNSRSGYMHFIGSDYDQMKAMLEKEGVIAFSGSMGKYGTPSTYVFKFDVDGYKEATKYLR